MSRQLAAEIVHRALTQNQLAETLIQAKVQRHQLDPAARGFLRELVFGTIRHKGSLDAVVAAFSQAPIARIERRLLSILRVGLYQMLFLDEVSTEVAVDAAVSTAKRRFSKRAAGFVNGVLRSVARSSERQEAPPEHCDPTRWLPISPGGEGTLFDRAVLADPSDLAAHLAERWSFPVELITRWLEAFGRERTEQIAFASNRRPAVGLRAHSRRTTPEELASRLLESGITSRPGPIAGSLLVDDARGLFDTDSYREGWFQVQDPTAQLVVEACDPQPGERVLDLCAAPGGKTTHLAERLEGAGGIVAVDLDAERLVRVRESCERLGATTVETVALDGTHPLPFEEPFDRALVDAPCSNTGVLARRVEARWRFDASGLASLVETQSRLLARAASVVRPGGRLVYSTCSLEHEENRGVVDRFLSEHDGFSLEEERCTWPSVEGWDGGYWARLLRSEGAREGEPGAGDRSLTSGTLPKPSSSNGLG